MRPTYIYFMQAGEAGPIKIGISDDPEARRGLLQVGCADELVIRAVLGGTAAKAREIEVLLHRTFAAGHIRGEWFAAETPGLAEAIHHAVQVETQRVVGERFCQICGSGIEPPRRKNCGPACEREMKRLRSRAWKASRVPPKEAPFGGEKSNA